MEKGRGSVCAFTAVSGEDHLWMDQYLGEAERLSLPFVIHFDRWQGIDKGPVTEHPLCIGWTEQPDLRIEFNEQHKQKALDLAWASGHRWALAWDVDEVWEVNARRKLDQIHWRGEDYLLARWLNCWDDRDHVRADEPFLESVRVKLYRLDSGVRWFFDHPITNGAKQRPGDREPKAGMTDLICFHHGLMTHALRLQHKARWDRIYTAAVGGNPYGFWDRVLDTVNHPPTTIPRSVIDGP